MKKKEISLEAPAPPQRDTKFILDRVRIEQEKIIANILAVVKKKPYPNKNTTHLATFVHSLFQTAPYIKHPHLKKKIETERKKALHHIDQKKDAEDVLGMPSLPEPPMPHRELVERVIPIIQEKPLDIPVLPVLETKEPALPKLEAPVLPVVETPKEEPKKDDFKVKEYVVNLFNTPIGVYVAPDEKTYKVTYRLIEPVINENVLKQSKELIKKDFQKNYKILDDDTYLKGIVEKACKKSEIQFTEDYTRKIKYFLKRDLTGFRRIDAMMQDSNIKGIYVDGINKPVIVEFQDLKDKIQSNIVFLDANDLNVLITKLARVTGNEISDDKPILNTIYEGLKIQATKGVGGATSKLIIKKVML